MSVFEKAKPNPRKKNCPVCGQQNELQVTVQVSELDEKGSLKRTTAAQRGRTLSRSTSFCVVHGEEMFLAGIEMIGKEL